MLHYYASHASAAHVCRVGVWGGSENRMNPRNMHLPRREEVQHRRHPCPGVQSIEYILLFLSFRLSFPTRLDVLHLDDVAPIRGTATRFLKRGHSPCDTCPRDTCSQFDVSSSRAREDSSFSFKSEGEKVSRGRTPPFSPSLLPGIEWIIDTCSRDCSLARHNWLYYSWVDSAKLGIHAYAVETVSKKSSKKHGFYRRLWWRTNNYLIRW